MKTPSSKARQHTHRQSRSSPFRQVAQVWRGIRNPKNKEVHSFKHLYLKESRQLGDDVPSDSIARRYGTGGEPWIAFTPRDRFGVCLSGGGIRSATFNLGLMQALSQLGVLKEVHYLSTVSGGGYIGGFWSAWLHRKGDKAGETRFPLGNEQRGEESAEVRHLREFSRFLLPRMGILETEFWGIAMTILGGLIPSLLTAIAVLFLGWCGWVIVTGFLLQGGLAGAFALVGVLGLYMALTEIHWLNSHKSENRRTIPGYLLGSLIALSLVFLGAWFRPEKLLETASRRTFPALEAGAYTSVFAPTLLFGACTLMVLILRVLMARSCREPETLPRLEGFERSATRFLGLTVLFAALATLWWAAGQLQDGIEWKLTATGTVVSASLFAWAKRWLQKPVEETHGSSLLRSLVNRLKRATPKLLALITWLLLFVLVATAMHALGINPLGSWADQTLWYVCAVGVVIVCLAAWLFDPARVGMHEFYRSRISRCYLGASNPEVAQAGFAHQRAAKNRQIVEREKDDLVLHKLEGTKPLHLICTAANDISGDTVGTLYRGARSAVLSANGISVGDRNAALKDLRLSSAMTASAAAFNSQMGRISMDLGPAVTFLMSALNLRLGLWVPHPNMPERGNYTFPGRFFLLELFGRSRANARHLHLSDGGHFENFGLYELIRRHTRYIIVSDCGADPEVAFDDLANVLRRVREDFGVEIELDIRPLLRGENGFAKQHAVVGTIHYNGPANMDKGTILFFKPALTGDEPPDVLQYHTRNRLFPHEGTGDQFYDEAQWESYRRLGEHAGRVVLGSFETKNKESGNPVDRLFRDARSRWHPAPDRNEETFLHMTERFAILEGEIVKDGPKYLAEEFFSELSELRQPGANAAGHTPTSQEEMQTCVHLLRVLQIMEDVWLAADLEQFWSHPLNEGWMNYFRRWARTPSFRRWWPLLTSIYSPSFRAFVTERFGVGIRDKTVAKANERSLATAQLEMKLVTNRQQVLRSDTWEYFKQQHAPGFNLAPNRTVLGYELELLGYNGDLDGKKLMVGLALIEERLINPGRAEWCASWHANELFVPHALTGSGIIGKLLDAIIKHYEQASLLNGRSYSRLEVRFSHTSEDEAPKDKPKVSSQAARLERIRNIEFYKSRGFNYVQAENPVTGEITLWLEYRKPIAGKSSSQLSRASVINETIT